MIKGHEEDVSPYAIRPNLLCTVAAVIRDWRSNGRPHRAYAIGGIGMVLVHALRIPRRPFDMAINCGHT